jgi:hypothetical protein
MFLYLEYWQVSNWVFVTDFEIIFFRFYQESDTLLLRPGLFSRRKRILGYRYA